MGQLLAFSAATMATPLILFASRCSLMLNFPASSSFWMVCSLKLALPALRRSGRRNAKDTCSHVPKVDWNPLLRASSVWSAERASYVERAGVTPFANAPSGSTQSQRGSQQICIPQRTASVRAMEAPYTQVNIGIYMNEIE